jgi:hypothetical protein
MACTTWQYKNKIGIMSGNKKVFVLASVISCGFPTSVQHSTLGQLLHALPTSVD